MARCLSEKKDLPFNPFNSLLVLRNASAEKAWGAYYPAFVSGEDEETTGNKFMMARQRTDKAVAHIMKLAGQAHFDATSVFTTELTPDFDATLKDI